MSVTIEINEALEREARHLAEGAGVSLSGWVAGLIRKEVSASSTPRRTLLELLGDDHPEQKDVDFPRDKGSWREVDLS